MRTTIGIRTDNSGGSSWKSWWNSIISATIEDAAPTNVVLTFPTAKTSLGASDFTIAGKTISSASWSGAVLTLALTESADYGDSLTVTFVKTGGTAAITNNIDHPIILNDGHTVAWYDPSDLTTITKDGSNVVSRWNDKLGSGHDLISPVGKRPTWSSSGITFNGVDQYMQTATFPLSGAFSKYLVVKQNTWVASAYIDDGFNTATASIYQKTGSGKTFLYCAADICGQVMNPIGSFAIIRAIYNGANSYSKLDTYSSAVGNAGSPNPAGITIGCRGSKAQGFSNQTRGESIYRDIVDTPANELKIYNYLKAKNASIINATRFGNGKLILTFDDARDGTYTYLYSMLQARGISATIYAANSLLGSAGYCTYAQLKTMSDNGIDIQDHTHDHSNLTTLTESEVYAAMDDNAAAFVANGLPSPTQLAYPFGAFNANVETWCATRRKTGRATTWPTTVYKNVFKNDNKFEIVSLLLDGCGEGGISIQAAKDYFLAVQEQKSAVVTLNHRVLNNTTDATSISIQRLTELVDYAISIGMDIITMSELDELMVA